MNQLCSTESQQNHGQQVGSSADHQVRKTRDDSSERADKVLRGPVRGRYVAKGDPRGQVLRSVGNQRQEKQRACAEEEESEDFIPRGIFESTSHGGSQ